MFIYVVFKIYGVIREKFLIDIFYMFGMCILYDRFLFIFIDIINSVIDRYDRDDVVFFFKLCDGIFIIVVVDSIDYNLSFINVYDFFYDMVIFLV